MPLNSQRTRSPGPAPPSKGHPHNMGGANSALTTPGTPGNRIPYQSLSNPIPMGPQYSATAGQVYNISRSTSVTTHMRASSAMQPTIYSNTPSPRLGTPSSGTGGPLHGSYGAGVGGAGVGGRYAAVTPNSRMSSSIAGGQPPPLPPRSYHGGNIGGQGAVFGVSGAYSAPPMGRQQQPPPPFHRPDASNFLPGVPYNMPPPDAANSAATREHTAAGSTSPHPAYDPSHLYSSGGGAGGPAGTAGYSGGGSGVGPGSGAGTAGRMPGGGGGSPHDPMQHPYNTSNSGGTGGNSGGAGGQSQHPPHY